VAVKECVWYFGSEGFDFRESDADVVDEVPVLNRYPSMTSMCSQSALIESSFSQSFWRFAKSADSMDGAMIGSNLLIYNVN
jgi:hypothetical protein